VRDTVMRSSRLGELAGLRPLAQDPSLWCDPSRLHGLYTAWSGRAEDAGHGCLLGGGSCGGAARLMPFTEPCH
jgi:hypothetical protein